MILIGQFDSSFVRRVAIAMELYGLRYQHRPWSITRDADKLQQVNPLIRVPTLVLDDGDVLIESHLMLDYLDSLVPVERRMFPVDEPARRKALKVAALATGYADKGAALFYEKSMHGQVSDYWVARCISQMKAALAELEADRAGRPERYWFGGEIGHADIAVACALRHMAEAHPGLIDMSAFPALKAHAARCEQLPVFQKISQPWDAPA